MKAFELSHFGLDGLRLVERPDPTPGPGQILLRMRAASLNYRDLSVVRGEYLSLKPPFIPISDGMGEVVALGPGVRRFKVGDRVLPAYITNWINGEPPADNMSRLGGPLDGVLAEYMAVSEESAVHAPSHLSDVEAVTLPIAALTAWQTLFVYGSLQLGQTVVVQGSGGVSLFALMLARAAGAEVIATSGNPAKLARLKELGAHHVINYRETPDWDKRVLELTERQGVRGADHVLDIAGGETLKRSIAAARVGGTVYVVGFVEGLSTTLDLLPTVTRRIRLQAVSGGHRTSLEALVRAMELHRITPVVDKVFPVTEVREALDYLGKGTHFGKVALSFEGFGR
ncbi:NAD(P)-dependent alcohol dehydrogenase [Pendulispora albinea]|uniref:NAD(P)-dependent alcohol dehydrogenase n=1 Tax=Pendulispora albinea TaxID=2741071 RepID=A0ABZ2M2H5_9BACT